MKFIKITGIIALAAALLISGGLYFSTQAKATKQQQQASPAANTVTPEVTPAIEDQPLFEEPMQQPTASAAQNTDENRTASAADIAPLTDRINRLQQQMYAQMRTCSMNAQQLRGVINGLEVREDQLKAQKDAINAQMRGVDSSTPEGQARRRELLNQRDGLENQRSDTRRAISNARQQFGQLRSNCRNVVNDTRSQKRDAENQLTRAFNEAMRINGR